MRLASNIDWYPTRVGVSQVTRVSCASERNRRRLCVRFVCGWTRSRCPEMAGGSNSLRNAAKPERLWIAHGQATP